MKYRIRGVVIFIVSFFLLSAYVHAEDFPLEFSAQDSFTPADSYDFTDGYQATYSPETMSTFDGFATSDVFAPSESMFSAPNMPDAMTQPMDMFPPTLNQADSQGFMFDYDGISVPAAQAGPSNYVEDWNRFEASPQQISQGASAVPSMTGAGLQGGLQTSPSSNEYVGLLREELSKLKGTAYEVDANKILSQMATNAPPEQYEADLGTLMQRIDANVGTGASQAATSSQAVSAAPIPESIFSKAQFAPIQIGSFNFLNEVNRVDRASSPLPPKQIKR